MSLSCSALKLTSWQRGRQGMLKKIFKNDTGVIEQFDQVFAGEQLKIASRRYRHHTHEVHNSSRFILQERYMATPTRDASGNSNNDELPAGERIDNFNNLLEKLQDPEQERLWSTHFEAYRALSYLIGMQAMTR